MYIVVIYLIHINLNEVFYIFMLELRITIASYFIILYSCHRKNRKINAKIIQGPLYFVFGGHIRSKLKWNTVLIFP